jgi:hypothetical protein
MTTETYITRARELGVDRGCFSEDRQFDYWELTTLGTCKQRKENQTKNVTLKISAKSLGLTIEDLSHFKGRP